MQNLKFDFNNMFSSNIGSAHGITEAELLEMSDAVKNAHNHLSKVLADGSDRVAIGLEWTQLAYQGKSAIKEIKLLAKEIAKNYRRKIPRL